MKLRPGQLLSSHAQAVQLPYEPEQRKPRVPGTMSGKIWLAPDFDAIDEEIIQDFLES